MREKSITTTKHCSHLSFQTEKQCKVGRTRGQKEIGKGRSCRQMEDRQRRYGKVCKMQGDEDDEEDEIECCSFRIQLICLSFHQIK